MIGTINPEQSRDQSEGKSSDSGDLDLQASPRHAREHAAQIFERQPPQGATGSGPSEGG